MERVKLFNIIAYLIVLALLHARLEIMIEGKSGWALRLPCWRINNQITKFILGKELTGYHLWTIVVFFFIFHSSFLFIIWNIKKELLTLGLFCWYWLAEDFFWFIESKHYGFKNFKKGRIFWHKRWILRIPVSYWIGAIIGTLLILGGIK